MPIYEYECNSCCERFERRQSVTEQAVQECPTCGGPVRRIYHPVGIVFKGSGFYSTDNRRDKAPVSANAASTPENGSKESKETKTENKVENKTETKAEGKSEAATASSSTSASK